MPMDPNIPAQALRRDVQLQSPLNAMLRVQALRRGQQEESLNALRMQQAQDQMARAPREHAAKVTEDFYANGIKILGKVPKEQRAQIYPMMRARVAQQGGDVSQLPEQWTGEFDLLADAANAPEAMNAYQQHRLGQYDAAGAELARHNKAMENRPVGGAGGSSPYYSPVMTAQGPMTFDHRTGTMALTQGGGNILPVTADPRLQGEIAGAKAEGKVTGETKGANTNLGKQIDRVVPELTAAMADGGLIDQATGSGIGKLTDATAAFVGNATPGAIAISQLRPIYDLVLKMVPRFEGPQSDKDTQSYREAAGQLADPAVPAAIKKAAAGTILRLMQTRKDQFTEASGDSDKPVEDPLGIR